MSSVKSGGEQRPISGAEIMKKIHTIPSKLEKMKDDERRKGVSFSNHASDSPSGQRRDQGR